MLRKNMTPDQLVSALLAPPPNPYIEVDLRTGLRLEQITAKLQTLDGLEMDPREFYELAKEPPAALLADYPWLERSSPTPPRAPRSRASCGRARTGCCPTRPPRSSSARCSTGSTPRSATRRLKVAGGARADRSTRSCRSPRSSSARPCSTRRSRSSPASTRTGSTGSRASRTRSSTPTRRSSTRNDTVQLDALDFERVAGVRVLGRARRRRSATSRCPRSCWATRRTRSRVSSRDRSRRRRSPRSTRRSHPDTADKYIYFLAIPDGDGKHVFAKTEEAARREPARSTATSSDGRPRRVADRRPTSPTARRRPTWPRWDEADRAARPARLARLRDRFADAGHRRLLRRPPRAHALPDRVHPGRRRGEGRRQLRPVPRRRRRGRASSPTRATRSRRGARRRTPGSSAVYGDLPSRWPELVALDRRAADRGRGRVRAARRLAAARGRRARRRARADRGLARGRSGDQGAGRARADRGGLRRRRPRARRRCSPSIRPGVTEADLALRLEWLMRTGGAEALAFDVACLSGPEAALPHGAPGRPARPATARSCCSTSARRSAGYRSDMTRTLFVGEPIAARSRGLRARGAGPGRGDRGPRGRASATGGGLPSGRVGRRRRPRGHRRGAATASSSGTASAMASAWRRTRRRRSASGRTDAPLPSPTVFSVEPGVYLDGETGVRIEDLVVDRRRRRGRLERLTRLPARGRGRRLGPRLGVASRATPRAAARASAKTGTSAVGEGQRRTDLQDVPVAARTCRSARRARAGPP